MQELSSTEFTCRVWWIWSCFLGCSRGLLGCTCWWYPRDKVDEGANGRLVLHQDGKRLSYWDVFCALTHQKFSNKSLLLVLESNSCLQQTHRNNTSSRLSFPSFLAPALIHRSCLVRFNFCQNRTSCDLVALLNTPFDQVPLAHSWGEWRHRENLREIQKV